MSKFIWKHAVPYIGFAGLGLMLASSFGTYFWGWPPTVLTYRLGSQVWVWNLFQVGIGMILFSGLALKIHDDFWGKYKERPE